MDALLALVCGVAVPWALGALWLWALVPGYRVHDLLLAGLAWGLGVGLTSTCFFVQAWVLDSTAGPPFLGDALLLLSALIFRRLRCRRRGEAPTAEGDLAISRALVKIAPSKDAAPAWRSVSLWALGFAVAYAIIVVVLRTIDAPHGRGDAVWIWNVRARFLFHLGEGWQEGFTARVAPAHPDYPLLLPGQIARTWLQIEATPPLVASALGMLFLLATAGVLGVAVGRRRGVVAGRLAAMLVLASDAYVRCCASQLADAPVAYYFLVTTVLLWQSAADEATRARRCGALLAGAAAGMAAWTKNEGIVWLCLVLGWVAVVSPRRLLAWCVAGALPWILVLCVFKQLVPATNDLVAAAGTEGAWAHLLDLDRYRELGRGFWEALLRAGGLGFWGALALPLLLGFHSDPRVRLRAVRCGGLLLTMLGAYAVVFLVASPNLRWHLLTAADRLLLQLGPSALFVWFCALAPWPSSR